MDDEEKETKAPTSKAKIGADEKPLISAYWDKLGKLLDLSREQDRKLRGFLKKNINKWIEDTAELHTRLMEDNDLVEGVVEDVGWPYDGAPNVHVPIPEIYMELYTSVEKRSILGGDVIWYATTEEEDPTVADQLVPIEQMVNKRSRDEWNIEDALEDVFWTTNRDGLGVLQVPYVEEYEQVSDVVLITSRDEFLAEFPTPQAAGLSAKEYGKLLAQASRATMETPVEVPVQFEKQTYAGPMAEVVELIDFVTFPATAKDISARSCRGYGKRFSVRKGVLKEKSKAGAWYEEAVEKVIKKKSRGETPEFRRAQDEIEGIKRDADTDDYHFYNMVVRCELEEGEGEKKYMVTYSLDCDTLMEVRDYPYRVDYFALFRIAKRPNRLIGRSIPNKVRDLSAEIDTQHNQRILSREISTVPSFKAKKTAKVDFDPTAEENRWRPGAIFWLDDPEAFEQFKVQPVDLGESMAEEKNDMGLLDLYLGAAASLMSGSVAPGDPTAPGNKTEIMIGQSNLRMDDPLKELRKGVDKVGEIIVSHLYQFGPVMIDFIMEEDGQRSLHTVHKKYLRQVKLRMKGVTVTENPGAEMQRGFALYAQLMAEPTFQQNPQARVEVLRRALRAGRIDGRERIMPTVEQLQQQQVQLQAQAMAEMEKQKQMAMAQAQAEAVKQRIAAAQQDMQIKRLAQAKAKDVVGTSPTRAPNGGPPDGL